MRGLRILFTAMFVFSFLLSPALALADHSDETQTISQGGEAMGDKIEGEGEMTQEAMNNTSAGSMDVASIFWPIVPGTTVADGTFFLKQLKESFLGMMKFGNIDKANYYTELSEKRIVEANKLVEDKDYPNALKSLKMSEEMRKNAIESKKKAVEAKEDALELINKMVASFEKQKQVLAYFSVAMPADQKAQVDEDIKNIELQISEAK